MDSRVVAGAPPRIIGNGLPAANGEDPEFADQQERQERRQRGGATVGDSSGGGAGGGRGEGGPGDLRSEL